MSVDTACSASLVALHLARANLLSDASGSVTPSGGSASAAGGTSLVAGVHVQAAPTSSSYVWNAAMLSPQGRCAHELCIANLGDLRRQTT